ncbi:histone-lysine N-methyltransferase, suvh protein, putative [Medicago truncatula]|uniref:Histone-lysine N-methyltransferase, suvh protein, putative n=1 Tax=Medicago truncatula TaxID=3880 RepID=G7JHZ4_MEDTR|nr:histone-lysine N-methyltransferase, suvh protein, putative [Medicago truncatula]
MSTMRNVSSNTSQRPTSNALVQFHHHNLNFPHLMMIAMENIPPTRDLSLAMR